MSVVRLPLQVQIVYLKDMSVVFDGRREVCRGGPPPIIVLRNLL